MNVKSPKVLKIIVRMSLTWSFPFPLQIIAFFLDCENGCILFDSFSLGLGKETGFESTSAPC